jgi:hypothetical protein
MTKSAGEGSAMDRLAYRIGYASARLDELARVARKIAEGELGEEDDVRETRFDWKELRRRPERDRKRKPRGRQRARESRRREDSPFEELPELAAQAAVAALASRILSPKPVNWPRAVLAGALGALASEAIDRVELSADGRKFNTRLSLRTSDDEEGIPTWLTRCVTGVALASLYAKYAYGRLPGPPIAQGLAFGALEAATESSGGAAALLAHLGSELPFPFNEITAPDDDRSPERTIARHLAFGVVLGLVYR